MIRADRKSIVFRILAVALCVSVAVFLSALLVHHHGLGDMSDHAHCQVCALGHITPSTAAVVSLVVTMQMLMLLRVCAPSRGSPSFVALPTTRPPPASR
jgi:hypothetical protein